MIVQNNTITISLEVRKSKFKNLFIEIEKLNKKLVLFGLLKFKYIFFYQIIRIINIYPKNKYNYGIKV